MRSKIGYKFRINRSMLGNPKGAVGYVFYQYRDFDRPNKLALQIIFPNGEYDGFSWNEQVNFLEYVGFDERYADYQFENVMQVTRDYSNGYWEFETS